MQLYVFLRFFLKEPLHEQMKLPAFVLRDLTYGCKVL